MAYIRDLERDLIFDYGTNGYKSATHDISKISDGENLYSIKDNYAYHEGELATVATTGNYNDLTNKPTIPAVQVQSDWNVSDTSSKAYIVNKPTIPTSVSQLSDADNYLTVNNTTQVGTVTLATVATTGEYSDLLNKPTIPAAQLQSDWNVSDTSSKAYIVNKPTIPAVDQTYNVSSANAQSGVAIEGMMTTKFQVVDSLPANPTSGVFYFIKE